MQGNTLSYGYILHGNQYNYKIEKVLGQGAFGITYLAKVSLQGQLGQLDSNVYVTIKEFFMKEINGREGTNVTSSSNTKGGLFYDYKEKFAREAKNLSKLKHPNIVNVMEFFEANNTCYYVMEYLEGGDLDYLIKKRGFLQEGEVIKYAKQIGAALSFMHKNRMLHLDLKPKNVMLNSKGDAILIDFGLSKQYDKSGEPESSTTVGRGTPGYAPIEQANYQDGHGFPVTMDVYALGGTIFKMLTGIRPPEASIILNDGFPYKEFSTRNINKSFTECIEKAMNPITKHRFQSIQELCSSISNIENIVLSKKGKVDSRFSVEENTLLNDSLSIERDVSHLIFRFDNGIDNERNLWIITSNSIEKTLSLGTVEKYRILQNDFNRIIRFLNDMHLEQNPKEINALQKNGKRIVIKKGGNVIYNKKVNSSDKLENDRFNELERIVLRVFEDAKHEFSKNKKGNGVIYGIIKSKSDLKSKTISPSIKQNPEYSDKNTITRHIMSLGVVVLGTLYAVSTRLLMGRSGSPDKDGVELIFLFCILTMIFVVYILKTNANKLKFNTAFCRWTVIIFIITNSTLVGMWNGSLTDAYMVLSICLSIITGCLFYKR